MSRRQSIDQHLNTLDDKTIILSIQYEYFLKIINGTKQYEYRFTFPKSPVKAFIYAPRKMKAIVGYIEFEQPIEGSPTQIAEIYSSCGDGSFQVMIDYIGNREKAYAAKVKRAIKLDCPISLSEIKTRFSNFFPPQSYLFLNGDSELLKYLYEYGFSHVGELDEGGELNG